MQQRNKKLLTEKEIESIIDGTAEYDSLDENGKVFYHVVKFRADGKEKSYIYLQKVVTPDVENIISSEQFHIKDYDDDDIRQECWIMLIEAAEKFNPRRGDFRSFCRLLFKGRLVTLLKKSRRKKNVVNNYATSMSQAIIEDNDGHPITYEDIIPSQELNFLKQLCVQEYHNLLVERLNDGLSELERDSFLCHLDDLTYKEAAEELGVTKKCYGNALQRGKSKISSLFEKEIEEHKKKRKKKPKGATPKDKA